MSVTLLLPVVKSGHSHTLLFIYSIGYGTQRLSGFPTSQRSSKHVAVQRHAKERGSRGQDWAGVSLSAPRSAPHPFPPTSPPYNHDHSPVQEYHRR